MAYTDNLKDFILNAMALSFIFEIPMFIYEAFTPRDAQVVMKRYNEAYSEARFGIPHKLCSFRLTALIAVNVILLANGVWHNMSFAHMVNASVIGKLCPNETSVMKHWFH